MKKCSKCKELKELTDFHLDKSKKDKHKSICKKCRNLNIIKIEKLIDVNILTTMYRALKYNRYKWRWGYIVGYTIGELRNHLAKQFDENMNWNNYGSYWRIDKIIPRSVYKNHEIKKCWNLKNLRPLSVKDCLKKKKRIYKNLVEQYNLYDCLPVGNIRFD